MCCCFQSFINDVIAHQADLRFINMAAQRFLDEAKVKQSHGSFPFVSLLQNQKKPFAPLGTLKWNSLCDVLPVSILDESDLPWNPKKSIRC